MRYPRSDGLPALPKMDPRAWFIAVHRTHAHCVTSAISGIYSEEV